MLDSPPRRRARRAAPPEPAVDPEEELQARVAWYYYVGNLTQQQIAARIGSNRVRVNRLLAASRESGLVQITINSKIASCAALERRLVERYLLQEATVVPTPERPELVRDAIGVGAGAWLSRNIRDGMTIGMGWGRTLRSVLRAVQGRNFERLSIVSLQGGLAHCSRLNTFEIVSDFADLFNADRHFFAAPIYASSAAARDVILEQDAIRETHEKARRADLAILTVGDMVESLIIIYGLAGPEEVRSLRAAGAVGDVLGHFVGPDGAPVDHPLNRRAVAISLEDLRSIREVVLVSGGRRKVDITRAALRGGYVTVLVTDEQTARRLV
ncbi:MAG: sugar-binding transcriptional regulator [Rhodospirillaceae bacterium]|nr:sugar-binding transcriptional regulator [Rhodospirillaceae bacterium]